MLNGKVTRRLILTAALTLLTRACPVAASAQDRAENSPAVYLPSRGWRDEVRLLGEAVRRVASRSDRLAARLEVKPDGSRPGGPHRKARLDATARAFGRAAGRLRNSFDELDYYSSRPDARELLRVASHLDRLLAHSNRVSRRVKADWGAISEDLLIVANAYVLDYGR
jgi:hypothetical protein